MTKNLFYFECEKCKADNQKDLIDPLKSNNNWTVSKDKCPFCKGKIKMVMTKNTLKNHDK